MTKYCIQRTLRIPYTHKKNLLELINEFGKVAGCEIYIQKSVTFLYTNNEPSERKTKKTIPFTVALKISQNSFFAMSFLPEHKCRENHD